MLSLVVLISGSGSNLRALLEAVSNPLFPARILAVGADNPAEGISHADLFGVPSFVVEPKRFGSREEWAKALDSNISHFKPDLIVLAGFMRVLPKEFVSTYFPNIINIHPSLLPAFPGAHAVADALAAGVKETGTTIHLVDEGVDTGPILAQKAVEIFPSDNEETLHERIKIAEHDLLVETVRAISVGEIDLEKVGRG